MGGIGCGNLWAPKLTQKKFIRKGGPDGRGEPLETTPLGEGGGKRWPNKPSQRKKTRGGLSNPPARCDGGGKRATWGTTSDW